MNITELLGERILILDGAMGTVLQKKGLINEAPELMNRSAPDVIRSVHRAYFDAGSNVVSTNTFGVNALKYDKETLDLLIRSAVALAKEAAQESDGAQPKFIALDIGPTGRLLRPLGDLPFEEAVAAFAPVVRCGAKYGADLIFIETMNDAYETKAALLAAKENCSLPVFVSNAYGADGKLLTGASPEAMTALLEGMGASALGLNCSYGPDRLMPVLERLAKVSGTPLLFKPNAGLPTEQNGKTFYPVGPAEFAAAAVGAVRAGASLVGGCCGTTPDHIRAVAEAVKTSSPVRREVKRRAVVSSYTGAVCFGEKPLLIGERINPTGKKRLKQALLEGDVGYLLQEAVGQQEAGADILDVNVGLPELDEKKALPETVAEIQAVTDLPLQLDSADPAALGQALRIYNGKALINSVNGKEEVMRAVFPLAKKYGAVTVALTLDENGIPASAEGRLAIARRILDTAKTYGLCEADLVFDPLCMAVSADPAAAGTTLDAVAMIRDELGCHTVLGVSNVSFGLPDRPAINAAFFTAAMARGLSAAIMNPFSEPMMRAYVSFTALTGADPGFTSYIAFASAHPTAAASVAALPAEKKTEERAGIFGAILSGNRPNAAKEAKAALAAGTEPLSLIENGIIPALGEVGRAFEAKRLFLPQLLMSAEAAAAAFEEIRAVTPAKEADSGETVVLLTVKGDVHDIGKNIVKLLLQNFGFRVVDLGKDVSPETALDAVKRYGAKIVGLSALMTTTVPAMRDTVALLHENAPECRVIVGGAVLTPEYAKDLGADFYAADAMETVRIARELTGR